MRKILLAVLLGGAPMLFAATPAAAQNAPQNGVLLIYGNDKCPTDSNGDQIVVCKRLDESERFRIPKTLRESTPPPTADSFAVRMNPVVTANPTGIGSCSTVGPGGSTGCFVQEAKAAKAEYKDRHKAETDLPLP